MDSANLHYQDQLVESSSLTTLSAHATAATSHAWSSNSIFNSTIGNLNANVNGVLVNSRNSRQQNDLFPSLNNASMIQDLGSHRNSYTGSFFTSQPVAAFDPHVSRIKADTSDSHQRFTEPRVNDLNNKHLLRTSSSGCHINTALQLVQNVVSDIPGNAAPHPSRGIFSQIFPTVNISDLNQPSSMNSLDMNLRALDLHTYANLSGSLIHPSQAYAAAWKDGFSYGLDNMHQAGQKPSISPREVLSYTNRVIETNKRSSGTVLEQKVPQATPKKSKLESHTACPPFKVRKEKLGDRVAALQQLVAPFGKTDTASVLMEAIGYIKFLQNQAETLSVPYMKSSRNKNTRTIQGGLVVDGNEEPKRDLRSQGLCLVPLSCLDYIADSSNGGVWPHPNFIGGI
uniref:Transcription factor bHLH24 n=1 Tax=Nothapodytes nimmoniana TaxID=159386 RepID=A0A9E8Z3Z2_NOTNI|nr:transcription factor bHLH24 [Nothapodytes nimmoniana]